MNFSHIFRSATAAGSQKASKAYLATADKKGKFHLQIRRVSITKVSRLNQRDSQGWTTMGRNEWRGRGEKLSDKLSWSKKKN
jgi:hypothetical protein